MFKGCHSRVGSTLTFVYIHLNGNEMTGERGGGGGGGRRGGKGGGGGGWGEIQELV